MVFHQTFTCQTDILGSQQICILILQSTMLMYQSAFGELRFDLVTVLRMVGAARSFFTQFVK